MGACSTHCEKCGDKYCARKVSLFSELEEQLLGEISGTIERKHYSKGELVFRSGEVSDRLYIVRKGKMKVYNYTKEGKESILYIINEGEFIGELNLLKKGTFDYYGEAIENLDLCIIAKQYFDLIIKKTPEIAFKILEALHDRVIKLEKLVHSLSTKDIETRIASLLISFVKDCGKETDNGMLLELPLNREDIGNFIGTTRETISRKMTSLQDGGVIEMIGNKSILIKDMETLKNML